MDNLICRALLPVEMPVGLTHLDSDLCWCDPIVEVDENGRHVLLHRRSLGTELHYMRNFTQQGPPKVSVLLASFEIRVRGRTGPSPYPLPQSAQSGRG
jgi:hypothetical protein